MLCFSFLCPRLNERADSDSRRRPRRTSRAAFLCFRSKKIYQHSHRARSIAQRVL